MSMRCVGYLPRPVSVGSVAALVLTLLTAPVAQAHKPNFSVVPVLRCWNAGSDVVCQSGWTTGAPKARAPLDVMGPGGAVLTSVRTDAKGRARFARPKGEYTVLMSDARGNPQTVELTWRDVDATKADQ